MMNSIHDTSFTFRSAIQEAADVLTAQGMERARLEAELLLAHVLEMSREELIVRPDQELTDTQSGRFQQLVERRRRNEPLAYIVGYREFWSREFKVNQEVLIPRPETEEIIAQLLRLVRKQADKKEIRILDVGTGSGILAVIAALELPKAQVTAVDCSKEALKIARENALRHQVANRIDFLEMDFMCDWILSEGDCYDYILSNPPYIASGQMVRLMSDIREYEPRLALDGGPDGLDCYHCITEHALRHLKPGGHLIFEVGEDQAGAVQQGLGDGGLSQIEIIKDLSGRDRVVSARRGLG